MRNPCLAPAALAVLLLCTVAQGQAKLTTALNSGIAARLRFVQFEILGGRLTATSIHLGTNWNGNSSGSGNRRERLSLDLTNPTPNIRYELSDKQLEITLEVTDGEKFLIRHVSKDQDGSRSAEYFQTPEEDLTLTYKGPDGDRAARGPTLWHLLLAEPEICNQLLAPTLELLNPKWQIASKAAAIEDALCQNARLRRTVDRERWSRWVADLGSSKYSDRQAAERELLDIGREVLPFLRSLDRTSLDAEQWRRVRNIMSALDNAQGDSIDQIVTLLAGDPRAWVSLLNRDNEAVRKLATEQLQSITDQPVDFDPQAEEETRDAQYKKLREQFNPEPPVQAAEESS